MADTTPDLKRLQRIYEDTQEKVLNVKGRLNEENRHLLRVIQAQNDELKDSLRYVEIKLAKSQEQVESMDRKVTSERQEIKRLEDQLARQVSINHAQVAQIEQMSRQLDEAHVSNEDLSEKSKRRTSDYQTEVERQAQEIKRLHNQLLDKHDSIKIMTVGQEQYKAKAEELEQELEVKCAQITHIRAKLAQAEQRIDAVISSKKSEGSLAVECQHLKMDNQRLLKLLRSTQQYKNFGEFAKDCAGGARYMGSTGMSSRVESEAATNRSLKKSQKRVYNEEDAWIPHQAYKIVNDFRMEHGRQLTDTMVNKLLAQLNKIWRERERKQIARVRNECNTQVMALRRQLANSQPLQEFKSKQEINKLKVSLKQAQKENRKTLNELTKLSDAPGKTSLIEAQLKQGGLNSRQKRQYEDQIQRLNRKLHSQQGEFRSGEVERQRFQEGADWIKRRFLGVIGEYEDRVKHIIETADKAKEGAPTAQAAIDTLLHRQRFLAASINLIMSELKNETEKLQVLP